jgi:hypothetical protein
MLKIDRARPTPASFWSYQAPPPPDDPPPGVIATQAQWLQLSPGYRREIVRQIERAAIRRTPKNTTATKSESRFAALI